MLWSGARVGGMALRQWDGWDATAMEPRIALDVRRAAYEVIQRKGATNHAIGLVTASLLGTLLRGERRLLTVSRLQTGTAGLSGVALSLPTVVSTAGGSEVPMPAHPADRKSRAAPPQLPFFCPHRLSALCAIGLPMNLAQPRSPIRIEPQRGFRHAAPGCRALGERSLGST